MAIDVDSFENADRIREFRDSRGYSWHMAIAHRDVILDYKVIAQSTKVAVDRNGVIRFRAGFGTKSEGWWEEVFSKLAQS